MDDPLDQALRPCLVQVTGSNGQSGSGFFVAPRLVVTCEHVIRGDRNPLGEVTVLPRGATTPLAAHKVEFSLATMADVALLQIEEDRDFPYVRLGSHSGFVHDLVRARGYPERHEGCHEEQITGKIEQVDFTHPREPWKSGPQLIKFKDAQVVGGFSGSPLVDEETHRVVGVVLASRDEHTNLGGLAVPAHLLFGDKDVLEAQVTDWSKSWWRDELGAAERFLDRHLGIEVPFFGREIALAELDIWLERGPPRALLVAKAGMGKSSLLAHWYRRLRTSKQFAIGTLQVELLPISITDGFTDKAQILPALARTVSAFHGRGDGQSSDETRIHAGLRKPAPPGKQCVLIIDGLDETGAWQDLIGLFPRELGAGIRLLIAAREFGDADACEWKRRLQWIAPSALTEVGLGPVDTAGHIEAARRWWSLEESRAGDYGAHLSRLTQGEPLLLGLYLTSLGRTTVPELEGLERHSPGLEGYFKGWWYQQTRQWSAVKGPMPVAIAKRLFDVLAAAIGPISRTALLAVLNKFLPCSGDELDDALQHLARFAARTSDVYTMYHPELARWRWRRLQENGNPQENEARTLDDGFVAWGLDTARRMKPQEIDPYVVRCLARHLQRRGSMQPDEICVLAGECWRAAHQRLAGWPADYVADLDIASSAAADYDKAIPQYQPSFGCLGVRIEIIQRQFSVERLSHRISASMARQLVSCGLWTPMRALRHVVKRYKVRHFPFTEALGVLAPVLTATELDLAMNEIAMEPRSAFELDTTLGAWRLAEAAASCGIIDDRRIKAWAGDLLGIGAAQALFAFAAQRNGETRIALTALALEMLWRNRPSDSYTALELGKLISERFSFAEIVSAERIRRSWTRAIPQVEPGRLSELEGVVTQVQLPIAGGDPNTHNLTPADMAVRLGLEDELGFAAALRAVWPWLNDAERTVGLDRVRAECEANLSRLETKPWEYSPGLDLPCGAIADVCPGEFACRLFPLLAHAVVLANQSYCDGSQYRELMLATLRFALRLEPAERHIDELPELTLRAAFSGGSFLPHTRMLFRALGALPEWQENLSALLLRRYRMGDFEAKEILRVTADLLPAALREDQWRALNVFPPAYRDQAMEPLLAAMARGRADETQQALSLADEPRRGPESWLLKAVLTGLLGNVEDKDREAARRALNAYADKQALRAQLLTAVAGPLKPWSLDEALKWVDGTSARSFSLSVLLRYFDSDTLRAPETPYALELEARDVDEPTVERVLRRIYEETSLDETMWWVGSMAESTNDTTGRWQMLAICALAGQEVTFPTLFDIAKRIKDPVDRAVACAALLGTGREAQETSALWEGIEAVLIEAEGGARRHDLPRILRRLRGNDLDRAKLFAKVGAVRLRRTSYSMESLWVDSAVELMPWADEAVIEDEFLNNGGLVKIDSDSDRDRLRAALAVRLMALGHRDFALQLARSAIGAWGFHADLLPGPQDETQARLFADAILNSCWRWQAVASVARRLFNLGDAVPPAVSSELCLALLEGAGGDAEYQLLLALLAPVLHRLGGSTSIEHLAAALSIAEDGAR
jgi:hypothetical protein